MKVGVGNRVRNKNRSNTFQIEPVKIRRGVALGRGEAQQFRRVTDDKGRALSM